MKSPIMIAKRLLAFRHNLRFQMMLSEIKTRTMDSITNSTIKLFNVHIDEDL